MSRNVYCSTLIVLLGLFLTACNNRSPEESRASTLKLPKAAPVDPTTAAIISGTVSFDGAPPHLRPIDMSNDPGCKGQTESEQVVVDEGHLANVLIYVKQGLPEAAYDPPKQSVSIKQEGCRYVPHMAAVMVGQPVQFEDETRPCTTFTPCRRTILSGTSRKCRTRNRWRKASASPNS